MAFSDQPSTVLKVSLSPDFWCWPQVNRMSTVRLDSPILVNLRRTHRYNWTQTASSKRATPPAISSWSSQLSRRAPIDSPKHFPHRPPAIAHTVAIPSPCRRNASDPSYSVCPPPSVLPPETTGAWPDHVTDHSPHRPDATTMFLRLRCCSKRGRVFPHNLFPDRR